MDRYEPATLGWWMDERRGELGLTWNEVAERVGVSPGTIYRIAAGPTRAMRTTTKKGIESTLNWAAGSVDDILNGSDPTASDSASQRESDSPYAELRTLADQLDEQIRAAQEQSDEIRRRLDALDQSGDKRRAQ